MQLIVYPKIMHNHNLFPIVLLGITVVLEKLNTMLEHNSGGKRVTENYVKMVNQTFTWRKSKREVKRDRVIGRDWTPPLNLPLLFSLLYVCRLFEAHFTVVRSACAFHLPHSFAPSPLSESLEQASTYYAITPNPS